MSRIPKFSSESNRFYINKPWFGHPIRMIHPLFSLHRRNEMITSVFSETTRWKDD
jgi:hypothetical protein